MMDRQGPAQLKEDVNFFGHLLQSTLPATSNNFGFGEVQGPRKGEEPRGQLRAAVARSQLARLGPCSWGFDWLTGISGPTRSAVGQVTSFKVT